MIINLKELRTKLSKNFLEENIPITITIYGKEVYTIDKKDTKKVYTDKKVYTKKKSVATPKFQSYFKKY